MLLHTRLCIGLAHCRTVHTIASFFAHLSPVLLPLLGSLGVLERKSTSRHSVRCLRRAKHWEWPRCCCCGGDDDGTYSRVTGVRLMLVDEAGRGGRIVVGMNLAL